MSYAVSTGRGRTGTQVSELTEMTIIRVTNESFPLYELQMKAFFKHISLINYWE